MHEGEAAGAHDILVCLKCGFQVRFSHSAAVIYCATMLAVLSVYSDRLLSGIFAFYKCWNLDCHNRQFIVRYLQGVLEALIHTDVSTILVKSLGVGNIK